ncbi:Tyrosine-protein phosphatase non-receptor type 7 [Pseudolycoriella hygida]|uniref:protein-tyrosine-phosphatase n=1 Tax=Pseudolycoriella hygida TaxID=35572 RepID=A0A9Q0N7F5_9DIPT|nr:Tyrosine-protein phosphatase non-receptor type 7 [Pseudolycoriella hygida]
MQSHQNDCTSCSHGTALMGTKHQQKFKHSKGSLFAMRQDESKNRSAFCPRSKLLGSFHEKTDFGNQNNFQKLVTQSNVERPGGMYLGEMKTSQSGDYLLGSNLQTVKTATLSVSNNNLKTLPEVMTLSDFGTSNKMSTSCSTTPCSLSGSTVGKSRNSIIQRRGSNHSLTLNAEQGLSVSNYSLGNLQGSNCNLSNTSCGAFSFDANSSVSAIRNKKNLLQRRGSNTSLTLNIQGSSNSLNRFNSHSSLNISQDGGVGRQKKGLLERRNSNTSLTLSIHNRALSISNCNLRGSECSLSSINVGNAESFDQPESVRDEQVNTRHQHAHHSHHRRQFLSSENLHNFSICLKPCDSDSNIHHGSVSDLKHTSPRHTHIKVDTMDFISKGDGSNTELHGNRHNPTGNVREYCDCVVRNISTKPLSPQTTSEDFKIYLANIQMLQSASNVLSEQQLRNLNVVFQNSYNKAPDDNLSKSADTSLGLVTTTDDTQKMLLRNLHQEFWDLPTNYQEKPLVFGSQTKNRYKTILPNEHSRVILSAEPGLLQEPYINANFIKGPDYVSNSYIATQGPLTNTIYEFWLMVYQNVKKSTVQPTGCQKIAMLTDFVENSRQKCAIYFPTNVDETMTFVNSANPMDDIDLIDSETVARLFDYIGGPMDQTDEQQPAPSLVLPNLPINCNYFLVKTIEIIIKNGYTIRKLCVVYLNGSQWGDESVSLSGQMKYLANHSFYCHHYWFPDWPDHRSPDDIDVLLDMSLHLLDGSDEWNGQESNASDAIVPLPVIHCSAGIGRTGCFAAILNGLRQMRTSALQSASAPNMNGQLSVDILGIVCNLRLQRGGMVQNSEQYELIHRALCLYQKRLSCKANA